ncbi:MAG: hypothetical protein P4M09_11070 [Devosia sp.]|nr:hypothetical protein [Devosia sp.]
MTQTNTPLSWNAEEFFVAAGGTAALAHILTKHGFRPPPTETLYVWRSRGQIPHKWVPSCVYVLLKEQRAKLAKLLASAN